MNIDDFVKQLNSVINPAAPEPSPTVFSSVPPSTNTVAGPANVSETGGKKIKVLIVSTHINQVNGYSKVTLNILQQLAAQPWISLVHFGTQKLANGDLGRKYPAGVKVIDGTAMEKQKMAGFAFNELPSVITSEKPNIVLIYNDL